MDEIEIIPRRNDITTGDPQEMTPASTGDTAPLVVAAAPMGVVNEDIEDEPEPEQEHAGAAG